MRVRDEDLRARFPESFGYLASVRKRAIRLETTASTDEALPLGGTHLGGAPDLPSFVTWPSVGDRLIPFVGVYVKTVDQAAKRIVVDWEADY